MIPLQWIAVGGALVAFVGVMFVSVALISLVVGGHDRWRAHQLRATPELPCTAVDLGQRRVAVRGTTGPDPAGILTAPLSGEPCVWWSVTVARIDRIEDGSRRHQVVDVESRTPISLTDQSGSVLVDGHLARGRGEHAGRLWRGMAEVVVDRSPPQLAADLHDRLATLAPASVLRPRGATLRFEVREIVLRAGQPATVVAAVSGSRFGPVLHRRRRGLAVMRPEPLAELRAAVDSDVRDSWAAFLLFTVLGAAMAVVGLAVLASASATNHGMLRRVGVVARQDAGRRPAGPCGEDEDAASGGIRPAQQSWTSWPTH